MASIFVEVLTFFHLKFRVSPSQIAETSCQGWVLE